MNRSKDACEPARLFLLSFEKLSVKNEKSRLEIRSSSALESASRAWRSAARSSSRGLRNRSNTLAEGVICLAECSTLPCGIMWERDLVHN